MKDYLIELRSKEVMFVNASYQEIKKLKSLKQQLGKKGIQLLISEVRNG